MSQTAKTNGVNGVANGHHYHSEYSVPLNTAFAYTPRKLRVITIGTGFSGLMIAHKFQHRFPEMQDIIEHTMFEAKHDLGGTWLVNTYPGVQCDVPSHMYVFPFNPNPNWTRFYSSGAEIEEYLKTTAEKWNLLRDVQFSTKVVALDWQEEQGQWKVTVEHDGERREEFAEIVISATGVLCNYKWPSIDGLDTFKGHLTHSADWDHGYDYKNQRIAVIGNGSSGIQIVPKLAELPGTEVTNFIRGPTWVYYRVPPSKHLNRDNDDEPNPPYAEEEKQRFREHPEVLKKHRKDMIHRTNKAFRTFVKGSQENESTIGFAKQQMSEKLGHDPVLCKMLIPDWQVGCRRITPGPGYLESFLLPNCGVTNSPITKVTEGAVHTADGKVHEVDVIVCATGFNVSNIPPHPIKGQNDTLLSTKWHSSPESYMSVATSQLPNHFFTTGPNAVIGHGSLVEAVNWTGDYIVRWIKKIAMEGIKYAVPKREAEEAFVRYADEIHKTLVWTGGCRSWYKMGTVNGRVTALFGGSALLFKSLVTDIRGEDWDIKYWSKNKFEFLGNGFLAHELDEESDLSWYVEN